MGSVVQGFLHPLPPGHGLTTWFRVCCLRLNALFRLAFAAASHLKCLTWPQTATRRLIMRKARSHPFPSRRTDIGLLQLVSVWFQVLFTPLVGVLFIVRSRYFSLSVVEEYLALEGGPPSFTRSSTSSVLLWYVDRNGGHRSFAYRAITFCGRTFQTVLLIVSL